MRILKPLAQRLLYGLLSLLLVSVVTFWASEQIGDVAVILAGEKASPETVVRIRHSLGLDQPAPVRYGRYLNNAVHGDFGMSFHGTHEPVKDIIARDLPMTARIAFMAILLSAIVGIFLGTVAGVYQNRFQDRAVLIVSTLGVTLPNFVLAPFLVYFFCLKMDRLPQTWEQNRVAADYMYLILPVVVLSARPAALLTRLTRASFIDTMQQEYIRLAIAKGVPRMRLIVRHALRNAILPVVTAIGTSFGFLLTGSFVVENFFGLPGLGKETIEAISKRDVMVVQACVFVTGAMFIVVNLIVDILLPILDPRIREAQI
ncbi:MAG: ABC transporter permease [Armatimonadetes bacterium]|nr:ABC transporter permease [Armatimonadota bacterium]